MLNSIILSSNMEKLFLIDNGRALEFDLNERGILIGLLGDQLSVATAMKIPGPVVGKTELGGITEEVAGQPAKKAFLPTPSPPLFPSFMKVSTEKSQWTLSFNPNGGYLFAIGATDIDFDRPEVIVKPRVHIFRLSRGVVRLTKVGKVINFSFLQKG